MIKSKIFRFIVVLAAILQAVCADAQVLSQAQKKLLTEGFDKHIKTVSAISAENIDMISVYRYQLEKAEQFAEENERYSADKDIYAKLFELKNLVEQNKEVVDFLAPRASRMYYSKAVSLLSNGKTNEAYTCLHKAVAVKPDNIMAHYELCKISLDSGQIVQTTDRLTAIINGMNPTAEQEQMCKNLLSYTYDKNLLESMSFIKQGKYAYAYDILKELDTWCAKDNFNICKQGIVKKNIEICQKGIYDNHIDITQKAISKGELKVAGDFVKNTYDYFQRNKEGISDTASFEQIVRTVVDGYIKQAKSMTEAKNSEAKTDLLLKAKELSQMIGGEYESGVLQQIALLNGSINITDPVLDSIEQTAQNNGYSIDYKEYIVDTMTVAEEAVEQIEKEYIPSSQNEHPSQSVAVSVNKTKTIDKAVDDKFFETRQFMQVNNYEKALEVLEKANRLAKMEGDKQAVEQMYQRAIREITAKRMSRAEYAIFQGDVKQADSLVALTDDLLEAYGMKQDTAVVRIMNSYLRAIDNKVCQKKQEEINVIVYDILDCIRKNDFYSAEIHINKAMQIKGNNECRLDKSRIRSLKRQIEEPLQYVRQKETTEDLLAQGDTNKYFVEYAKLEHFYYTHKLSEMSVNHTPLRQIIAQTGNDKLAIKITDELIKYKQYEGAVESLGALKELGYKSKYTKKAQQRIGKMMSFEQMKRQDKIEQSYRMNDKYMNDKWFKYFLKSYKKHLIKFQKIKS